MLRTPSRIFAISLMPFMLAVILSGCTVGPNYKRPAVDTPQTFRGAPAETSSPTSFGEEKWSETFQDPQLQALIRKALQQNLDVRIAATRILQAQAQLTITHGNELPSAAAFLTSNGDRNAQSKFINAFETSNTELGLGFQWDLDFWGKYRRATEASRDQLLASDWARKEVITSVIANVASAYFTVREQDLEIQISRAHACLRSGFAEAYAAVVRSWPHFAARRAPGRTAGIRRPLPPFQTSKKIRSSRKT